MRRQRILITAGAALLTLLVTLGAAQARVGASIFGALPKTALQGKKFNVVVRTKTNARCALSFKFADGATQTVGSASATGGRARWVWQVPEVAQPGRAVATAACAGAGTVRRTLTIVGSLIPPRIDVLKDGFSVRPKSTGSSASYGMLLKNLSSNADAVNVYVLVNMVMGDGQLIGTVSKTIDVIGAGTTYAYGGSLTFRGAAPIDHLEIVVKIGGRQRGVSRQPVIDNIRLLPGRTDAAWMGEIDGEVVNDHATLNVKRTDLSAVVMDAGGHIIGGGTGNASTFSPPGTRQVFVLKSGVDAIAWSRVASVVVSPQATYTP